jgi:hypothetical protein
MLFSTPEMGNEHLKMLREGNLNPLDMQMLIHCSLPPYLLFWNVFLVDGKKSSPLYARLDSPLRESAHFPIPITNTNTTHSRTLENSTDKLENNVGRGAFLSLPRNSFPPKSYFTP